MKRLPGVPPAAPPPAPREVDEEDGLTDEPTRGVYDLYGEHWNRAMWIVVRARTDAASLVTPIREAARAIDPELPAYEVGTLDDRAADSIVDRRLVLRLLLIFGAVALGLSAIGIYGLFAQSVIQRRQELGIRLALGATPREIGTSILSDALRLAAVGAIAGLGLSLVFTRLLRTLLYGVTATEPLAFIAAATALLLTAMLAAAPPMRRASSIDPASILRSES